MAEIDKQGEFMMQLAAALVTVDWLYQNRHQGELIIFDASMAPAGSSEDYKAVAIIAGAQRFDISKRVCDLASDLPNTMPDALRFQALMREFGVNRSSCIVVYDHNGIFSSARAWWMFRAMGFNNVAVLDGGLPAWMAKNYPLAPAYKPIEFEGDFIASYHQYAFVDADAVLAQIEDNTSLVLDARSPSRFSGTEAEPRSGMRSGHIPNAKNLPYSQIVKNGFMLPESQLQHAFSTLFDAPDQELIFSCGSGVTACILTLGAHLCGYNKLAVYDGSWSEWGARMDLPVAARNGGD